jgi:hypothetical protein
MRLEGTLDAFSLPDVFTLLSMTKKTGTLHLRRDEAHGAIHLRDGAVTGARSDVRRQALARRLVGAGLVEDEVLASAVERLVHAEGDADQAGLGKALADGLDADAVKAIAAEQVTDAVFDLLRWDRGEFAFVHEESDPDDLGVSVSVDEVVAEGRRRIESWSVLSDAIPDPDALVCFAPTPVESPTMSGDEWQLLQLVDGRRTVADLVQLSGRGDYALVTMLAAMVARGLLVVRTPADGDALSGVLRRQNLLAALEGMPLPADPEEPTVPVAAPTSSPQAAVPAQVIPERPEPFAAPRRPEHPDGGKGQPAYAEVSTGATHSVGVTIGATALQPDVHLQPGALERDPSINKSLLLRLIAGVRGL